MATIVQNNSRVQPKGRSKKGSSSKKNVDMMSEIRNASKETLYETAGIIVDDKIADSAVIDPALIDKIPRFDFNELKLGKIIGRGGFCMAIEIEKIKISENSSKGSSIASNAFLSRFKKSSYKEELDNSSSEDSTGQGRYSASVAGGFGYASKSTKMTRVGIANLARRKTRRHGTLILKQVDPYHYGASKVQFLKGIADLTMEAKFLASLDHPNIITLCGMSQNGPAHFIVLERLKETLSKRFKKWMQTDRQCKGITGVFTGSKRKIQALYEDRINTGYDIASACDYLHQRGVIFRDLKPDNIGYDLNGTLKLFDFGLAKELKESDRVPNGLYRMTGLTGAIRYMAPEVGTYQPYNQACDVYSWTMVMWFIMALEPPFGFYTEDMIKDRVFQRGSRPAIFGAWSNPISDLLRRGWSTDIGTRPSFGEVCSILRLEMVNVEKTRNDSMQESTASANSSPADMQ